MVYCVGLTGDISSGKTTVATLFSKLGIEIIYADKISRELTARNQAVYQKIIQHYGVEILNDDRELNRNKLRDIIFSNAAEKKWLEQLLHPLINLQIKKQVDSSTSPYCIAEIPLLITKQAYPYLNKVLLIDAPREVQISRVMQRDQCTRDQAQAIISAQPNFKQRLQDADDLIINNSGMDKLTKAVNYLHHQYLDDAQHEL